jgi:DNA polymerase-3 subunit delta'
MSTDHTKQLHWPLLGNSPVKRLLQSAVSHQKVAHAYLFVGPTHVGKFASASIFANSLVCQNKNERRPCGSCPACDQFAKGLHPDVDIIDPNENQIIPIGIIRTLQHKMSLRSFLTEYKIAIINMAEKMTEESANALLKTLEEPTPKTVFVLIAESKDFLPQTISSRCQIIHFTLTQHYQIENWLIARGLEKKKASSIARFANGRPGTAMSLIDSQQPIQEYQEHITALTGALGHSISERLSFAADMSKELPGQKVSEDIEATLESWIAYFRDQLFTVLALPSLKTHSNHPLTPKKYIPETSSAKICRIIENILQTKKLVRQNANPRLVLENLILIF